MSGGYGLYVHVPFCFPGKCPYCDFYSVPFSDKAADAYVKAVERAAERWAPRLAGRTAVSVYFGGGTPSLLGARLADLLASLRRLFAVSPDAEVTAEANPGGRLTEWLPAWREASVNRLSMGMQSAVPSELRALGRRHTPKDVSDAVSAARAAGFENISLDLMLATPGQTPESARDSVDFATSLGAEHVSAYLLKVEPGTAFAARGVKEADEDMQADCYLAACEALEARGYLQYEISNFAKPGFASRHNVNYWDDGEYLGLGPGAHGFLDGRRFYYERDLPAFLKGAPPQDEGPGGGFEEYVMLRLRLTAGLSETALLARTGRDFSAFDTAELARLQRGGFLARTPGRIALTRRGFLVSNAVIADLLP